MEEQLECKSLADWPEGQKLRIGELRLDEPNTAASVREGGIRLAEVPLCAKGRLLGIPTVATRHPRRLAPEERSLRLAIGRQLGAAIANARLRQEALMAERLAAAGRAAASVTHDLRSAEFLARPGLSPYRRHNLSQAVISQIHRSMNTTQQILDYVREDKLRLR